MGPHLSSMDQDTVKKLFANSSLGLVLQEPNGCFTFVSKGFCSLVQMKPDNLEGTGWKESICPTVSHIFDTWEQGLRSGEVFELEVRWKAGAGFTWTSALFEPLSSAEPSGLYRAYFTDITREKQLESELERTEKLNRLLSAAFSCSPSGIIVAEGPDATITLANEAALGIRGGPRRALKDIAVEVHSQQWQTFHADGTPYDPLDLPLSRAALKGETVESTDVIIRDHTGEERWVLGTAAPIYEEGGKLIGGVVVFPDITQRKQVEKALEESEKRFRNVFDQQLQFSAILSPEGVVLDVNETPLTAQGFTKGQFVGKLFWDSPSFIHLPEVREQVRQRVLSIPSRTEPLEIVDEFHDRDGRPRYVKATYSSVSDDSGYLLYILVQANDITEQREGEKRLEKINDNLLKEKRAAKSLAAELTRSNEELEQFAYVASHDLQEPLRMLASYVELLESKLEGTLDTKTVRYMGYITEGASRLQNLINDLLLVSRVNREGKKPQPADSREVVTEALSLLRPSIEEANAVITLKQLPTVTVDKIQLRQVFQNLIGNSLKYRGVERAHISVGADKEEHGWRFWVQDNGIGIEAKHHERVFLIFKRLHRRDGYEGSGIGLALVKKIVERHGGQVGIEAADARGCMVWFTIPEPPAKAGEVLDSP